MVAEWMDPAEAILIHWPVFPEASPPLVRLALALCIPPAPPTLNPPAPPPIRLPALNPPALPPFKPPVPPPLMARATLPWVRVHGEAATRPFLLQRLRARQLDRLGEALEHLLQPPPPPPLENGRIGGGLRLRLRRF
ncbi:uncharacterized proline-rich protein-like [Setaria italica]|uniref:uncharacterized proline-rich protein-like n=1 Tax=Setaria italica TaxID=4555 RepID=UPI000647707E|nr:uncharacterized proline-rich protein-like [Setaria italica]